MDEEDRMSEEFNITSVCRNDIIQMIDDSHWDELKKVMLIRNVRLINNHEMKWIASKLADGFCNCCFWDILEDRFEQIRFEQIIEEKING